MTTSPVTTADLGTTGPVIDGTRLTGTSLGTLEHINPSTARANGNVLLAGPEEIDEAVAVAKAAYPAWRALSPDKRRRILQRVEELVEAHATELGRITALELGTPLGMATALAGMSAAWFGYYAGWADKIEGVTIAPAPAYNPGFDYTLPEPYGVVGIIVTWNGPISSMGMKVAPALAAGNCVIVKTPDLAPFTVSRFAEIMLEAGVPPGVLQVLPGGAEAGDRLVRHPDVGKISFTGGIPTAQKILDAARHTLTPVVLELGGKTANIVFPDADLDRAVAETIRSCYVLSGQGCNLNTRLLVHTDVYDEVVAATGKSAAALTVGDPFDARTVLGPVMNRDAYDRILGVIDRATGDGARVVAGGGAVDRSALPAEIRDGYFLQPTVLADVDPYSDVAQNEVFGPVLSVIRFDSEEHAIELANCTRYGLGTAVQTRDVARVHRLAPRLQSGNVHFNGSSGQSPAAPFGGYKASGIGREGGKEGLFEFLQIKNVYIGLA